MAVPLPVTITDMASVSVADVIQGIGQAAPWAKAAGWDPVGLQLGDPTAVVERVAVCHEVTESVVATVEEDPVDLVVSYHPLLFQPTAKLVAGRTPTGRALRLIGKGVNLAVAHTNFDVAPNGSAAALAEALGVTNPVGFGPLHGGESVKVVSFVPEEHVDKVAAAMSAAGAGRIGNYHSCSYRSDGVGTFVPESWANPSVGAAGDFNRQPEVRLEMIAPRHAEAAVVSALIDFHPYDEPAYDVYDRRGNDGMVGRVGRPPAGTTARSFATLAAEVLGGGDVRLTWGGPEFNLVAVVPGSGADFIDSALGAGANLLVTGDVSHHRARYAADRGLGLIDPGHARTERPGVARLLELVQRVAPSVTDLTGLDPSPWEPVK